MTDCYNMIADTEELKWFFDHIIKKPSIVESYTMVFVCRHKKLTDQEKEDLGLTRSVAEFLSVQTLRPAKFKDGLELEDLDEKFTYERFERLVRRFNVDKMAYTTAKGYPLPERSLAVIFYVNPCNDIKVYNMVNEKMEDAKTAIAVAMLNGKGIVDCAASYQTFGNIEDHIKHCRAQAKGSRYWMDFDIDVPAWFKDGKYYGMVLDKLQSRFGKGNYAVVDTGGGYHILVNTNSIRRNPHEFCKEVTEIYELGLSEGNPEYFDKKFLDENGCLKLEYEKDYKDPKKRKALIKFEAEINDSQIPGLPLPGTYQYGRPVRIINKEDFK